MFLNREQTNKQNLEAALVKGAAREPLIMFWYDDYIFKQFNLTGKAWKAPNGETVSIPKDDGHGNNYS